MQVLLRWARECLIFAGFVVLTTLMTWPWALYLRDAVADPGDPYQIAWTLWWDYHQTFHDPLRLFHANVFYPYQYTLAFSENDFGIAMLFFPMFAAGFAPLTVHSVATFMGFAFSGYGAFRLTRTTTGSIGAAWVSGITFAFIPYRFHLLSHLHYLFAGWLPLLLEALVLFARRRSWCRASWLGVAFLMNALTCLTWFSFSLIPLAVSAALLVMKLRLQRDRAFWVRGALAIVIASLLLLPFLWPYVQVSRLYGLKFPATDAPKFSATAADWLSAERRNKTWIGLGDTFIGVNSKLFPGAVPVLLACVAVATVILSRRKRWKRDEQYDESRKDKPPIMRRVRQTLRPLYALALVAGIVAVVASVYPEWRTTFLGVKLVGRVVNEDAQNLVIASLALAFGLKIYARRRRGDEQIVSSHSSRGSIAYGLALVWLLTGFLLSIGTHTLPTRLLYEFVVPFRNLRLPARAAMISYVGLALLAGLGALQLVVFARRNRRFKPAIVYAVVSAVLLYELRVAPLEFSRGVVEPDEVTLLLKATPMRGGIVELPSSQGGLTNHLYMLRAADHERPLVNATSSFITPETDLIFELTKGPGIDLKLLELFERIPVSYVVVRHGMINEERRQDFDSFISQATTVDRLRLVRTFADGNSLYAVTKTEPEAVSATK